MIRVRDRQVRAELEKFLTEKVGLATVSGRSGELVTESEENMRCSQDVWLIGLQKQPIRVSVGDRLSPRFLGVLWLV